MSIVKLTLEFSSLDAAQIFLSKHIGSKDSPPENSDVAKPVREAKAAKPAPGKNGPVVIVSDVPEQTGALSYDHVKAAAMKLANKKGRDALIAVLASKGFTNATDAKPEQYKSLIEALKKAAS